MILRYAHTGPQQYPAQPHNQPTSESPYWDDRNPVTASGPRSHISPTQNAPEPSDSGLTGQVESVEIRVAPGVQLAGHARQIVAAVLDLLQGKVTRQKMSRKFWAQDAVFEDNMKKAVGIEEVDAQWWGLKALMKDIKMLRHEVTSVAPNRVEMEVENKYVLRHMPTSTGSVVRSTVVIEMDDDGKIKKVQDKRNGHFPEGKLSEVMTPQRNE
jgi:hypothetical protein